MGRASSLPIPTVSEVAPLPAPVAVRAWSWRHDGRLAVLLALIVGLAFAGSLQNGFVYDDVGVIQDNPRLDDTWNLWGFFTARNLSDADGDNGLYRPLMMWSFAIDRALFGPGPFGVHLGNVLMNALLAAAVYGLVRKFSDSRRLGVIVALLYGLHPVHTEVVANGVGRGELGAALFGTLAGILHFAYLAPLGGARLPTRAERRHGKGLVAARAAHSKLTLFGAVGLYFVALLFKESIVTLPGLLFLLDWLVRSRGSFRAAASRLPVYLLYAVPLALFFLLRNSAVGGLQVAVQEVMAGASSGERLLHASEVLACYVGQLFFPLRLCAEYADYRALIQRSLTHPGVLISFGTWVVLALAAWWLRRREAWIALAGIGWFFLAILPVSNLLIDIGTVRADRFLFLPALGFALALGAGIEFLSSRALLLGYALLALVLGFYAWRTHTRNLEWRSQESLWTVTVQQNPGSAVGWGLLADVEAAAGRVQEAEQHYKRAFELRDGAGFFYPQMHNKYAALLLKRGDRAGAEAHYRLVVSKSPRQFTALCNLGEILLHDPATRAEAIGLLSQAIVVKPNEYAPRINLAQALKLEGRHAEALKAIVGATQVRPADPLGWEVKADIAALAGDPAAAAHAAEQARKLRGR